MIQATVQNLKKEKEEGKEIQLSESININETARGRGTF